jgi:hypothetical protein
MEAADRLDKLVSSLMGLQSIGAMTAIEVRNTVDADPDIRLVLDPNPQIVEAPTAPNPTPNPGVGIGFSG